MSAGVRYTVSVSVAYDDGSSRQASFGGQEPAAEDLRVALVRAAERTIGVLLDGEDER